MRFDGGLDPSIILREWPVGHCVKCLVLHHPDDAAELRLEQERQVLMLVEACRGTRHELLLEVIPPKDGPPVEKTTIARAMERFYAVGVYPDWWKLPSPATDEEWGLIAEVIERRDPHCRGVLLLGLDAPPAELEASLALAARHPVCKGFAVGRTIFARPARAWLEGEAGDEATVAAMAQAYGQLIATWDRLRSSAAEPTP